MESKKQRVLTLKFTPNARWNKQILTLADTCCSDSAILADVCSKMTARAHPQLSSPDMLIYPDLYLNLNLS